MRTIYIMHAHIHKELTILESGVKTEDQTFFEKGLTS